MLIVVDASVILKLVLHQEEEDALLAFRLLEAYQAETIEIRLPTLWRYEVGNILSLKLPGLAEETMDLLLAYNFHEEALHREYCLAVLTFIEQCKGVSFYDAAYHVLAIQAGGTYITADARYLSRAQRKGHVALLSDWTAGSA